MFVVARRATLLIRSGPAHDPDRKHLFVVLNDPAGPAGQVILVGICSIGTTSHDTACVLGSGDHPFIQHDSYVDYHNARLERADRLQRAVDCGEFIARELVSEEVYARIMAGVRASRRTKRFVTNFFDENGL